MKYVELSNGDTFIVDKINFIGRLYPDSNHSTRFSFQVMCDGGTATVYFEVDIPDRDRPGRGYLLPAELKQLRQKEAENTYERYKAQLLGN